MQYQATKKALGLFVLSLLLLCLDRGSGRSMPRPQWTVEQCRLYGRKGGSQRKGKKLKSDEWRAGPCAVILRPQRRLGHGSRVNAKPS
jgi:hypothetical protein